VTIVSDLVDEDFIEEGFCLIGSSIGGLEKQSKHPIHAQLMLGTARPMVECLSMLKKHLRCTARMSEPRHMNHTEREPPVVPAPKSRRQSLSALRLELGHITMGSGKPEFLHVFDQCQILEHDQQGILRTVDAPPRPGTPTTDYEMATWATGLGSRAHFP